ncbi:MAG: hypothetical protein MK102_06520 [Fuerstiella sp.]|nr:hypothetical protein [Fuerstiella sp.]
MIQSTRTISLRQLSWMSVLSLSFFFVGCTTPTESTVNPVTRQYNESRDRSANKEFQDPFRESWTAGREVDRQNAGNSTFTWDIASTTAFGEPLQITSIGNGGFRSLVVGSIGGDDRAAVKLTEELARYVHRNQLIMGGVSTTILRTLNPDGMKLGGHENSDQIYLNRQFPGSGLRLSSTEFRRLPKEIQFLVNLIDDQRPERIIHIRTVRGSRGMLAASSGAENSGFEVAEWLNFTMRRLPADVSDGTLESWAADRPNCDVITVGIPRRTKSDEVWALYGDAVLNLLLDGKSDRRRMVRKHTPRSWTKQKSQRNETTDETFFGIFQQDTSDDHDAATGFSGRIVE